MRELGGFFCKVESSAEISPEKLHFAVQVALQDTLSVLVCKLAMNVNRGLAGDRSHIPSHLATLLETPHSTVKHDKVGCPVSIAVAFAVHVPESALLFQLLNKIFVNGILKFRRQFDFAGCNNENLIAEAFFAGGG